MKTTETKERPILFTGEMVRALLDNRKTQTRRLLKRQDGHYQELNDGGFEFCVDGGFDRHVYDVQCPYGKPGDRLWVRETFFHVAPYKSAPVFAGVTGDYIYRAEYEYTKRSVIGGRKWRPSIFMPRVACRLLLEIESVRIERLNDISEQDAIAEGIAKDGSYWKNYIAPAKWPQWSEPVTDSRHRVVAFADPCGSYGTLWDSLNGKKAPWSSNPWVWVVTFKPVGKDSAV